MIPGVQIFRDISGLSHPVRFAIEIDDNIYRLFSYFPVGKDLSIAMQTCFSSNHLYSKKIDIPPDELAPNKPILKISQVEKEAEPFDIHKSTFHKSGILNIKDKKGGRIKGDKDIVSIPFSRITDTIRLIYLYPAPYSVYPKLSKTNKKPHNILKLVGNAKRIPPIVEVRLSEYKFDLRNELISSYEGFIAYIDHNTLADFQLDIFTVFRKSPNPDFPKTQVFIREFY